jgi:hypothetical protein
LAFDDDFQALASNKRQQSAWIAYRESPKTSIAKIAWVIARKQVIDALRDTGKDVSGWGRCFQLYVDSYNKANAERILFGVVTELQSNKLLISDY